MAMEMSRSTERKEENEKEKKKNKNTTQHHTSLKGVFPEQMPGTAATVCIFLQGEQLSRWLCATAAQTASICCPPGVLLQIRSIQIAFGSSSPLKS